MGDAAPTLAGVLVGRGQQLDAAAAMVAGALDGAGGFLLITGEAGIGKTRLADEVVLRLAGAAHVSWGTCWDDPGTPPFWPWPKVIHDCAAAVQLDTGDDLAPLVGTGDPADGPAEQLRLRLYDSVARFLGRASAQRPLLLVVEDLHVADIPALQLLRYLATALRGHRIALLGTARDPSAGGDDERAAALAGVGRTGRTLALSGLDPAAVAELVQATTGTPPDPALVAAVHDRTAGNPLFVIETAKLLSSQDRHDATPLPIPPTVRQVIGQRLAYLGGATLSLLAAASVLGQTFSVRVLARMVGTADGGVTDTLEEAVDARLVQPTDELDSYRFAHALVRDVLYSGMPARERRDRHRRAAEAIEAIHAHDLDAEVASLADHYVLALPDADRGKAIRYTSAAGQRAIATLAYEEAARHFARGVKLARATGDGDGDGDETMTLLLSLGDARMRAGDWPGATAAYDEAAAAARRGDRPDQLARAALGLGAGLSGFEVRLFDHRQIDLLREALDRLGDEHAELRAWVLARLSVAESFVVDDEMRVRRSREAVAMARRCGDPGALVHALSSYCDAIAGPDHSDERLAVSTEMVELGVASANLESELLGRRFRIVARLETGDIAGVDDDIDAFERSANRLRWPLVEWYPPLWRGMRALIEGRLADAAELEERARQIGRRAGSGNAGILTDVLRLQRLMEQGRPDDAHTLLARFVADPEGGPNAEAWLALPLARAGRTAEAHARLDRLVAGRFPLVHDGAWLEVIASVAEAAAGLRHREAAAALLPMLAPYADRFATGGIGAICLGSMRRHLGLLTATIGRLDDAEAHMRQALAAHRRAGATLLVAHTQRQLAEILAERDVGTDRVEAAALADAANALYRGLGLTHWLSTHTESRPPAVDDQCALKRDGNTWTVRYDGTESLLRHVKGLSVLARLLAEPGREFHVADLAADGDGRAAALGRSASAGAVLDDRARREYQRRLADLDEDIDDATTAGDPHRAERAQLARDALVTQLTSAYGLGGRARYDNDPAERARWTVTKQLRTAIERIAETHPRLGRHLTNAVRTGRYCSYQPEHPTTWLL